jgi:hypothetical protein
MTDFSTIVSNNLEEVHMIAGAEQTFYYNVFNQDGTPINLTNAICEVLMATRVIFTMLYPGVLLEQIQILMNFMLLFLALVFPVFTNSK